MSRHKRDYVEQERLRVSLGLGDKPEMTALIDALSNAFGTDAEIYSLKIIALLSGLGLLISLLRVLFSLTYGLDLSPGFF